MSRYTGQKCPVCNQVFTEQDDIVVCPDCGTPYHRSCWEVGGVCLYADKHGTGYEWKPEGQPESAAAITCPRCGGSNPAGSRFCNGCGLPLAAAQEPPRVRYPQGNRANAAEQNPREQQETPFHSRYDDRLRSEDLIDGIKAKDWAAFVQTSIPFYLLNFHKMAQTGRKLGVSLSAFILGPIYFFYRKAWKPGIIFAIAGALLMLPNFLAMFYVAGVLPVWLQNVTLINFIVTAASYATWFLRVLRGLFGVYMYKQCALPRIRAICDAIPEGRERQAALSRVGGTSMLSVGIYLLVCFAVYLFVVVTINAFMPAEAMARLNSYVQSVLEYLR